MIRPKRFFADHKRALDPGLGISIAAEIAIDLTDVVQDRGDRGMLGSGAFR